MINNRVYDLDYIFYFFDVDDCCLVVIVFFYDCYMYDYCVVGSGLFGAVFSHEAIKHGKSVLVIEKRSHIGGNIYTEDVNGINVHRYGAHIFHTNNKFVWDYVNQFAVFNRFTNSPLANYKGQIFSLPFNMLTFNQMWGVKTPKEAFDIISKQRLTVNGTPKNLEEQAISLVGSDIYIKLIKCYTEKQWGRDCKELPSFIIKRLPVRFTYDNNYFDALYQGIPVGGYTKIIKSLLKGTDILLETDYLKNKAEYAKLAKKIIFTGPIDSFFDYSLGTLEYRTVKFKTEILGISNFQGNAVVNYTDSETPFTRIIEHKWFQFGKDESGKEVANTVISKEYPSEWVKGDEPYYPVNDQKNLDLYDQYKQLSNKEKNIIFGGRLGEYRYYDMDKTIESALELSKNEFNL